MVCQRRRIALIVDLIDRALQIEGWTTKEELVWLHAYARDRNSVMEIGSWGGRSAMALRSAKFLTCIDHWQGDPRIQHYLGSKFTSECQQKEREFTKNHEDGIANGFVKIINADTHTANGAFDVMDFYKKHHRPSMVFIDGSHDYEGARHDIRLAMEVSRPGALICGHDYYEKEMPGLVEAITELLPHYTVGAGTLWYAYKE